MDSASFGEWLRRQREMREISLRDIADRTKISLRYLEAMETNRFDLLPAPVFAKGFLREYARYVGLSPDEVVNHYLSAFPQPEEPNDEAHGRPRAGRPPVRPSVGGRTWSYGLVLTVAGLVLLALVALAAWLADRRPSNPAVGAGGPAIAAPPLPTQPPAAPVPDSPRSPLEVNLDFARECWVEALIDSRNTLSELRVQGESLQLEAERTVVLTLGDGGAVEIHVNGYPLPMARSDGKVVRDLLIDLDTARALKEKKLEG
jgi:cytoskeletal protein RodZ